MNAMRGSLLLLASAALVFGAGCHKKSAPPGHREEIGMHAPVPDPAHALELRVLAVNENGIDLEFRNEGNEKLYLIDRVDPVNGVTRIEVKIGDREDLGPRLGVDWLAQPEDLVAIAPDQTVKRSIPRTSLAFKPQRVTFRVRYKVTHDSFFLEPWRKGMLSKDARGKDYEAKLARMMAVWLGEAVSNEVTFDFSAWPKAKVEPAELPKVPPPGQSAE